MKYDPKLRKSIRNTKAYNNQTFINSREARPLRIQCELIEPNMRLKRLGVEHLISFFGSARLKEGHPDYNETYKLAYKLGEWTKKHAPNVAISSGGGPGIMEATNKGAIDSGALSVGMGIDLPFEQRNNLYITPDLDFGFHYFFTRKYWCTYLTKAFVVMPGGVGTLDELFEILTLIQTQKITLNIPIVLFNKKFWESIINFDALVDHGTIAASDIELFEYCDDVDAAYDYITQNINVS
jgi:uncharacterized protein (TIGR00730 family)